MLTLLESDNNKRSLNIEYFEKRSLNIEYIERAPSGALSHYKFSPRKFL